MKTWGWPRAAAWVAALALLAACSEKSDTATTSPDSTSSPADVEAGVEAAAVALRRLPDDAREIAVTDFDQLKDSFGVPDLDSTSPQGARDRFRRRAEADSAILTPGLLRDSEVDLLDTYGFTQDDVRWEAEFTTPEGPGYIIAFREDLTMDGVADAVADGVAPLAEGEVDTGRRMVAFRGIGEAGDSLADVALDEDSTVADLVRGSAVSTYLDTQCASPETVYGRIPGTLSAPAAQAYGSAEPLEAFSVAFGTDLATARLGPSRTDLRPRVQLTTVMPRTDPDFALGLRRGVVDPGSGRIGFEIVDPVVAARLARDGSLPFAICARTQ